MLRKLFAALFPQHPPDEARNLGRNALCWCGSGKKYKQCHYKSDQDYFQKKFALKCSNFT